MNAFGHTGSRPAQGRSMVKWTKAGGTAQPLGASRCEQAQARNFTVYSKHSERVTPLHYAADDVRMTLLRHTVDSLPNKSAPIWHCRIPRSAAAQARYCTHTVSGPQTGGGFGRHAFSGPVNVHDSCARTVVFPPVFAQAAACAPRR